MQLKDLHDFRGGMNKDDSPSDLPIGDYPEALNVRTGSSDSQHGVGPAETLQGEIEILLGVEADIQYYGDAIGGDFIYAGYSEVQIGTQVWMKKNYDVVYPGSKVYNDVEANAAIYGRLYTHNQVMTSNFCPPGWHVPTEVEIDTLLTYLGGAMLAGGKMKETGLQHWTTPNTGADDISKFSAIPGGKFDLLFSLLGSSCLLWLQDEGEPVAPVALNGSARTPVQFVANWLAVEGATGYYLDVATDAAFTAFVAGWNNKDVGNVLLDTVTGLTSSTPYYYRVRAYNEVGASENSNVITITTLTSATDWFLPSKDELNLMYVNLHLFGVGGFDTGNEYWSSSEAVALPDQKVWKQWFDDGVQDYVLKDNPLNVRACRSFNSVTIYALRDIGPTGGRIFHIIDIGGGVFTYYEAASVDQGAMIDWSNVINVEVGTGIAIGDGAANTLAVIAQPGHVNSAAKLCNDLVL